MKRALILMLSALLLLGPTLSHAEPPRSTRNAREFLDRLPGNGTQPPEPTPQPTPQPSTEAPKPTLDAALLFGDLFGDLFRDRLPSQDTTTQPDATVTPPEPTATPEPEPEDPFFPSGALFDEGVRRITGSAWGCKVDFAYVGGWAVNRGYFDGNYRITGVSPLDGSRVALSDTDPMSFVSTGDAIVYFGEITKGDYGWMSLVPGERIPLKLPLDARAEVFCADDRYIWYYTSGSGESETIGRMAHDGSGKKKIGTVKGRVVTMLPGGEALLVNFSKNRVQLWKNGAYETIYSPDEPILSVVTVGKGIWVEHADGYGLLTDGELSFRMPGRIMGTAGSSDQLALLVLPYEDAEFFDVYLFNELYRAYAGVGRVKRSDNSTFIELQQDQMIVWGPEESLIFEYPVPELWLPYGYYDFASAENFLSDEGWMQLLVGSWCAAPWVGSGYAERLVFTEDALYRLPPEGSKAKVKTSLWFVLDGWLLDYADRDAPRRLWLSGPFSVPPEAGPYSPCITLDGKTYYQYSDDPAYFEDLKDLGIRIDASVRSPKTD